MRGFGNAVLLIGMVLGVHARDLWQVTGGRANEPARAAESGEPSVILVVADGLRWQEVFRGADASFPAARAGFSRREALMPFMWNVIAREGQLYGNRDLESAVQVTNPMKFSYPGYNELLVGWPDARIDRNDFGPNPNVTVFEWMHGHAALRGHVAAVGMWDTFLDIFNVGRSKLPVSAHETDAGTFAAASRYLRGGEVRALFVGFGATDDLAHKERYDLTLDAAHAIDGYIASLWRAAQAHPAYRGRTTLIVVADHGRGRTAKDWMHHNADVPGSEETWMAVLGPDIEALGEVRGGELALAQTAATVAAALGLDYAGAVRRVAPPVPAAQRVLTAH